MVYFIFVFKQKTAYELRISGWSSDVCSSDLADGFGAEGRGHPDVDHVELLQIGRHHAAGPPTGEHSARAACDILCCDKNSCSFRRSLRSEEHTSELQSLMRISYAVFCLKKKKKYINLSNNLIHNCIQYICIKKKVTHGQYMINNVSTTIRIL